jgi:hypothetical protein
MTKTRTETVAEWMTRTGRAPACLPVTPAPEALLLPASYLDYMTLWSLERWEEEAASGKAVTLASVDRPAPYLYRAPARGPLAALAQRAGETVDLWLYRGGFVRCEMAGHDFLMSACAADGRGVEFDNRGMCGWHGTTSAWEPWAVISMSQRIYWGAEERLSRALEVVRDLDGVTEPAKRALQTLLVGADINAAAHHQAQALRAEELEGVEPLDVPGW